MEKTKILKELFHEFGDNAQEALDFIANETNRRKLAFLESEQSVATIDPKVEDAQVLIALEGGRYITKDQWLNGADKYSQNEVVGIAVSTPLMSFIVSLHQWKAPWSKDTDHCITGRHTEAQATQILSGYQATKRLAEAQKEEGDTVAKICWNYGFKGLQWYAPCLLELGTICAYQQEINDLLELVDGEPLDGDSYYWSSTDHSQHYSWYVYFGDGDFYDCFKYNSIVVRAVAAFL